MPHSPRVAPTTASPLPDWCLASKLDPPPPRADAVPREAVLAELERSRDLPLALLLAPPGFGKTTVLSQWHRRLRARGRHAAWIGLDEDDAEPERLLGYLALALRTTGADPVSCAPLLAEAGPFPADALNLLIRAARTLPHDATLLVDDYDRIDAAAGPILLRLIEHAGPRLRVVLATRRAPALPLARFRSQGRLLRVDGARLSFDEAESRTLLGDGISAGTLSRLAESTEGWPVALHLARLWLSGRRHADDPPPHFSGRSPEIAAYLAEQVIDGLEPACREFLLCTGPLDRFDASLADHVRDSDDSGRLLARLAHLHGLLIPLDHEHAWFRYHPLLADFLRQQLERESPGGSARIRIRAARWFDRHHMLAEAVRHAALAGERELAAACLARAGTWQLLLRHGPAQVRAMLRHFDHAAIRDTPALNLTQACLHIKLGEHAHARLLLERFRDFPAAVRAPFQRDYTIMIALLREMFDELCGNPQARTQLAAQAAALDESDRLGRGVLGGICAATAFAQGNFATAERHARAARQELRPGDSDALACGTLLSLGQCRYQRGEPDAAEAFYLQAASLASRCRPIDRTPAAASDCLLAQLHYQRGHYPQASERLDASLGFLERHDGHLDLLAGGYEAALGLARLRDRSGRAAMALLDHVEEVARARRFARLSDLALAWRLQVMLDMPTAVGADTLIAQSCAEHGFLHALRRPHRWRQRTALGFALGRWHYLRGRSRMALAVLRRLDEACLADDNRHDLMRTRARIALVLQLRGEMAQALPVLHEVLDHVERQQAWQIVIELGLPAKAMLRSLRQHDPEVSTGTTRAATVQALLERMQHDSGGHDDFSEREREVLAELAAGHSNKQIGRRLHLSENTVKFHLKNLYRKLGANTRKAALDTAARRGLLQEELLDATAPG